MIGFHREMGGPHNMNLEAPSCISYQGTVQHELLHVVGLLHEQARADRDNAVIIYWENIDKSIYLILLLLNRLLLLPFKKKKKL